MTLPGALLLTPGIKIRRLGPATPSENQNISLKGFHDPPIPKSRLLLHPQAHHHRAARETLLHPSQELPILDPLLNTRRLTVQTHHNTIPRLRRPTPRVGLSSFTACSSCPCRQLWNAYAIPASFCLQRLRSSPLCLSARLYS